MDLLTNIILCLFALWLWSVLTIAPWFFMLSRLKNMGYEGLGDVRRLAKDLGYITAGSVMFCVVLGLIADVVFNAITGSAVFIELPRETLFTARVKRWSESADKALGAGAELNYRERQGALWRKRLNAIMPGHV